MGRFICSDPLADKFHWVSPYNYAENSPIANIDWWGLQKVWFQAGLKENKAYMKAYNAQRKTTLGKQFSSTLKNQSKYNVLYITYSYSNEFPSEGVTTSFKNYESFKKSSKGYLKSINKEGLKVCFEDGAKELIVIGISNQNKDENNKAQVKDAAYDLNHEEGAHGIDYVDDGEENVSQEVEHDQYYGTNENSYYSPSDEDVKTDPKYKGSPAQQNYKEIDDEIKDGSK